ncbi:MAG: ABC transporter permease, partial [Candidatus Paceibacterota bacterium]
MISDYFKLAFKNLKSRKTRSFLTVLGIFIGIMAVVALISIGQGMQNAINEQFESLGKDKIIVMSGVMGPPGSATSKSLMLTENDLEAIQKTRGIENVIGFLTKSGTAKYNGETEVLYVFGVDPD